MSDFIEEQHASAVDSINALAEHCRGLEKALAELRNGGSKELAELRAHVAEVEDRNYELQAENERLEGELVDAQEQTELKEVSRELIAAVRKVMGTESYATTLAQYAVFRAIDSVEDTLREPVDAGILNKRLNELKQSTSKRK